MDLFPIYAEFAKKYAETGFTRNLDVSGNSYSFNLFDRQNSDIYLPAVMQYKAPMSIVYLRNYPMSSQDRWHYYSFTNGRIVTACIDPADGKRHESIVAADRVGAGIGEQVMVVTGSSARMALSSQVGYISLDATFLT